MGTIDGDRHGLWSDKLPTPAQHTQPATRRPTSARRWTPFLMALVPSAILAGAVTIWLGFQFGGETITSVVSQGGQGTPALAAVASCAWAAHRSRGRLRWAWALLAASAGSWAIGEMVWSYYTLLLNVAAPFPSLADAGFLGAIPFAVAGVLSFPTSPDRRTTRTRAILDGAMVALSLFFVSWALGLGQMYHQSDQALLGQAIGLAYPVGDIIIGTVLFVAIRRADRAQRGRLMLLLGGLAAMAFSDSAFSFLLVSDSYLTSSYLFSTGWVYGYAMIALAPLWPEDSAEKPAAEAPISILRTMLPWLGLVAVGLTAAVLTTAKIPMDPFLALPGAGLVIILMASQALSYKDSLGLVMKSREAEAALQARTSLLNQVISYAPLGVARISREFRFIDANPRLGSLLHAPMQILVGAHVSEFVDRPAEGDSAAKYAALASGELDTIDEEGEVRRADATTAWLHWTTTAVTKVDGEFDYYLTMAEDMTARHEAEDAAMENLAGLERLNKMKSEFVSMVSHEFRTALVGIQGFSEMIRDEELEVPDIKGLAGDINNDAMRLNRMISEMLDLDRMEAGKIHLDLKPVDINAILEDAIQHAQVGADRHHLVAALDLALPVASGDSDRIIQVVSNLLSNAIKYSPEGGEVRVASRSNDGSIEVSVQDHGVGIPAEFIDRIFGRYERFESNRTSKVTGTGLGLAISRQIVELHGGRIWVESQAGKGSIFHFTIPAARTAPVAEAA
jgi:PAS domain S-box-containing protein